MTINAVAKKMIRSSTNNNDILNLRTEAVDALSDVMDATSPFMKSLNISSVEIRQVRTKKREEQGTYDALFAI